MGLYDRLQFYSYDSDSQWLRNGSQCPTGH
jgi:hypothetical protein